LRVGSRVVGLNKWVLVHVHGRMLLRHCLTPTPSFKKTDSEFCVHFQEHGFRMKPCMLASDWCMSLSKLFLGYGTRPPFACFQQIKCFVQHNTPLILTSGFLHENLIEILCKTCAAIHLCCCNKCVLFYPSGPPNP
jgi:hypothetical protein